MCSSSMVFNDKTLVHRWSVCCDVENTGRRQGGVNIVSTSLCESSTSYGSDMVNLAGRLLYFTLNGVLIASVPHGTGQWSS